MKPSTRYFKWMCRLIRYDDLTGDRSYSKLLSHLNSIDFTYILELDGNRESDGLELRYDYGYENGIDSLIIASELDTRPCSVLEMLVALCRRCEIHVMDNPAYGDRTGLWFWQIIDNIGLMDMDDSNFNKRYVNERISILLNREFNPDGSNGGLVYLYDCQYDLRNVDFWYHMMWYFSTLV